MNSIIASGAASLIEVITTHPLDYAKTLQQNNNFSWKTFTRNPYCGLYSRILGILPLRIIYWNSINYFSERNCNPILTGTYTAFLQTLVDYPIEQIKINQMLNKKVIFNPMGYISLLSRNTIFAVGFTISINSIENKNYSGAIGGLVGSLLSHPIDSLKTYYQAGNKSFPKNWKLNNFMKGWYLRCGVSLIGMNVGYISYNYFNTTFYDK